jgi:hypothetical protein
MGHEAKGSNVSFHLSAAKPETTPISNDNATAIEQNPPTDPIIPTPPPSFVPFPAVDRLGWRPLKTALALVPDALAEIAAYPEWNATFGRIAPTASQIEERLQVAAKWSHDLARSKQWTAYVQSCEGEAWRSALATLGELKVAFQLVIQKNPELSAKFSALGTLLDAQAAVARRSAATKRKKGRAGRGEG